LAARKPASIVVSSPRTSIAGGDRSVAKPLLRVAGLDVWRTPVGSKAGTGYRAEAVPEPGAVLARPARAPGDSEPADAEYGGFPVLHKSTATLELRRAMTALLRQRTRAPTFEIDGTLYPNAAERRRA
jgi:hypothetical protein